MATTKINLDRQATAAGYIDPDNNLLPQVVDNTVFVLAAGEGLLVQGVTSIAATTHMVVNVSWEEYV